MKRLFLSANLVLLALLAVNALVAGCTENDTLDPALPTPLSEIVPVTVRAMNGLTNTPVEGAAVVFTADRLFNVGLDPLRTDRFGRASAGVLNGRPVEFSVRAAGFKDLSRSFALDSGHAPVEYIVALEPERPPE